MNALARNFQVPLIPVVRNHPGANNAEAYRSFVRLALNQKLAPKDLDLESVPRASVFFPPALTASINAVMDALNAAHPTVAWTFQSTVAGLAQAGSDHIANKQLEVASIDANLPFVARPDQASFYKALMHGLDAAKVVIAEASTGVGKGRALMAAAIKCAQGKKTPVIVAAPTVVVVNHLWSELQALRSENFGNDVSATILPGASEFADDVKLLEWLNDDNKPEEDPPLAQWIRDGAPHTADDAIAQVAKEQGITLAWLMSDLDNIATNLPVQDYVLKPDASDKTPSHSRELLAAIRQAANRKDLQPGSGLATHAGADLIICTHAMLAIGQKTKWAVLPPPAVLIIDEGHMLEETISQMNSEQISLFAIRYRLSNFCRANNAKKGSVPRKALDYAKGFLDHCKDKFDSAMSENVKDDPVKYEFIHSGIKHLTDILRSRTFASEPSIQKDLYTTLSKAETMMRLERSKSSVYMSFSPDKRYPLISVGADNIGQQAGALWKTAAQGVILASATMYITDGDGNQKCDYVCRNLSVPITRRDTPMPIVSQYIYTLPTLHLPGPTVQAALSRPDANGRRVAGAEDAWLKTLANRIANITADINGGTLVLTSSYDQIKGIAAHIQSEYPQAATRLTIQTRGKKFSAIVNAYKESHRAGGRPILLGLGPAWTGLDLLDKASSAAKDTLLTTLIVACCPVGLNHTPTMQRRIETTHTSAIAKEALLILKQGLGRLIRRDGVKNRHIWILDGRIWSSNWLSQFTGPAKRLLAKYKNVEIFGLQ